MAYVSVIVPVYNVEKYLAGCIESILSQTYKDFELILVDDGAKDTSGLICDEYAAKDDRITVIHKQNGGLSHARNTGIAKSSGKYLLFVDSDDWIEPNTLRDTIKLAEDNQADVVIFGYFADIVNKEGKTSSYINHGEKMTINNVNEIAAMVVTWKRNFVFDASWNKLYLAEIIKQNDIQMPVGEIYEDTGFNLFVLPYLEKIVVSEKCYYHYMQRDAARITNTYNPHKFEFLKKRHISLLSYLSKYFQEDSIHICQSKYIYLKYVFSCVIDLFMPSSNLTTREKHQLVKEYKRDSTLVATLNNIKGFSRLDLLIIRAFKSRFHTPVYMLAKTVHCLKYKYKKIFFNLKEKF